MKLTEHQAKTLLAERGVAVPSGRPATTAVEARAAAEELGGAVAVKAQVRSGGRGKAGGIAVVSSAEEAAEAAERLLGMELGGEVVVELRIEQAVPIAEELYLSITVEPSSGRPMIMRSDQGGVEIESMTDSIERKLVGPNYVAEDELTETLLETFYAIDAVLLEINPLAVTTTGEMVALDAKIEIDDSARFRQEDLFERFDRPEESGTEREQAAAKIGLRLIELGGNIAVLANGAGLTMATMDAIVHAGGSPANFLEIGGDAYTKATPALELVLSQPGVTSLLVNFCGAFARCDVMTAGVVEAWKALAPDLPINFSISGTGQDEAEAMVRNDLGLEPHKTMASAVAAAVVAAGAGPTANSEVAQ